MERRQVTGLCEPYLRHGRELRLYGEAGDVCDLGTTPSWDPVDKPHYYDFCGPDGHGLYDDTEKTGSPVPHGVYITEVRNTNSMLNKIAHVLAANKSDGAGGSSLLFFNPLSAANVNETKKLGSMEIQYESAGGVGIALY